MFENFSDCIDVQKKMFQVVLFIKRLFRLISFNLKFKTKYIELKKQLYTKFVVCMGDTSSINPNLRFFLVTC